jgi:hypothetical protein
MTDDGRRDGDIPGDGSEDADKRTDGVVVDLDRLEKQAAELYLHRFVDYVKQVRGDHGRYLTLRAGDETAIEAAGDGSAETLKDVIADPVDGTPEEN